MRSLRRALSLREGLRHAGVRSSSASPGAAPGSDAVISGGRRRERAGLWLAALLFAAIFLLRLFIADPVHPIALLYAIPVLIVAIERGAAAGVGAALLAVMLAAVWDLALSDAPTHPVEEYVTRGMVVVILGASFGALANRFRASIEAQARFWAVSGDLLATADPSGYMTRVSPSWTRELGWSATELTSRPFVEFVHPDDRAATIEELQRVIEAGDSTDFENRYLRRDGEYRTVQWRATADPGTGLIFAAARDITERVEIQRRLQEVVEEANRANEAKSAFLSHMSHELRTPLNAILGFTQLLEFAELEPDDREAVSHIREGGDHLLALVSELLEISVIETGHMTISLEPVAAAGVLDEVMALIAPLADEAGVELRRGRSVPGLAVLADRQRLTQVLINLISNAVKYNRAGGTVTVACEHAGPAQARFVIADDGPGMDEDDIRAVFNPFERLGAERARVEGTGLGLPLSKRLVELMGGTLEPRSRLGEGTTMRVGLAIATASRSGGGGEAAPERPLPAPGRSRASQPRTVVYIEDDDASTELVQRALEYGGGVRLFSAVSGTRGLELVREHLPDIVLLDLDLPDLGGAEILRRLKDDPATAWIPVIVISAATTEGRGERLLAAGACAFLSKPVDIARLLELTLVGSASAEREPKPL